MFCNDCHCVIFVFTLYESVVFYVWSTHCTLIKRIILKLRPAKFLLYIPYLMVNLLLAIKFYYSACTPELLNEIKWSCNMYHVMYKDLKEFMKPFMHIAIVACHG